MHRLRRKSLRLILFLALLVVLPATRPGPFALDTKTDDKKTEERTYQFGKLTKDQSGLYARLKAKGDESNYVFVVRPEIQKTLQGELRDRKGVVD